MGFRRESPYYKPEKEGRSGYSEFEEEIKPPVRKRLNVIIIASLALTTIMSVAIAKVSSDQNQQASQKVNKAVSAQGTAEAQVTALESQVSSMMATLLARGVISGVQTDDQS
ncbi:MAG TPA: hypothetical protein VGK81_08430, partial [Anaerolineae bacterium]